MYILNQLNELKKEDLQQLLKLLQTENVKQNWNKRVLVDKILQQKPENIVQSLSDDQINIILKDGTSLYYDIENPNPRVILQNYLNQTKYSHQKLLILEGLPTTKVANDIISSNPPLVRPHKFRGGSENDYEVFIGEAGTYCTKHIASNMVIQSVSPNNIARNIPAITNSIITEEIFLKLSKTVSVYKHYTQLLLCNQDIILHEIQKIKQLLVGMQNEIQQGFEGIHKHLNQIQENQQLKEFSIQLRGLISSYEVFIETEYDPDEGRYVRENAERLLAWLEENKWDKSNPGYYAFLLAYVFATRLLIEIFTQKGSKYQNIIKKRLQRTKSLLEETIKSYLQDKTPYELFVLFDECTTGYLNLWFGLDYQIQSHDNTIQLPPPMPWNDHCSILRDVLTPKNTNQERLLTAYDSIDDVEIINTTVGQILGQLGVPNPEYILVTNTQASLLHQFTTSDIFSIFEREIQEHLDWKEFKLNIPSIEKIQIKDFTEITFGVPQSPQISHKMIYIPKGNYRRTQRKDGKSQTETVTVDNSFFVGKYPVTQKEYFNLEKEMLEHHPQKLEEFFREIFAGVIRKNKKLPLDRIMKIDCTFKGESHPVETIPYSLALLYCLCRNHLEQLESPYFFEKGTLKCDFEKKGYRLLSSCEWEYCAIANEYNSFYFGHFCSSETRSVNSSKPNRWGICDLLGNVEEMVDATPFEEWKKRLKNDLNPQRVGLFEMFSGSRPKVKGGNFSQKIEYLSHYSDNSDLIFDESQPFILAKGKKEIGFRICRTV